jgi:hypothetical protein
MEYTLRSSLDLSQVKELKRDEPLRVAAVRDGRVLGSRLVSLAKAKALDKLAVDVPFDLPPGESPAGVELRIGPDAPEAILPHYDALAVRPPQDQLAKAKPGAVLDLGVQKIADAIYLGWWRNCHRYTFTGRLVRQVVRGGSVCNQPVPGAVVEAYDVDRFFFWLRKTLITATTTDANGYFTMTFRWCCWRWWFYPYLGWYIDQPQWDQLRDLLGRFRQLVPNVPIPVDPNPPDPPVLLRLAQALDQLDPQAREKTAPFPGDVIAPQPGLSLRPTARPVKLTAEASKVLTDIRAFYPWWWWQGTDCYPDVLFRATQAAAGGAVIYDEPYSATRWNVAPSTSPIDVGNLNANASAVSVDNCPNDIPEGDCFKFTDVGLVQVPNIGSVTTGGSLAGYAYPGSADEPFGGTLNIYGGFGRETIINSASFVDYYKLQVAPWGGNPASLPPDGAFNDIPYVRLEHLVRSYWGVVDPGTPGAHTDWIPFDFGPQPSGPAQGLYRTVESFQREFEAAHGGPPGAWGWLWTAAQWIARIDTSYLPDGLAVLRLVGYRQVGSVLTSRVMLNCTLAKEPQTVELLPLTLDNSPLSDVTILGLDINGHAQPNAVCQELALKKGDVVTVHFRANDPRNHLSNFSLAELHRLGCSVSLLNGSLAGEPASTVGVSNYAAYIAAVGSAARPSWGGGSYKVSVVVGDPPPASAGCNDCGYDRPYFPFGGAYDIRLDAWKRVTNGYNLLFSNESNMLVVVKRTDAP